jgi:preprotein translocase subunit YajC
MNDITLAAHKKLDSLKVGDEFETQGKLYQVEKIYDDEIDVMELDESGQITFKTDTLYKDMLLIDFRQDFEDDFVNMQVDMEREREYEVF